MGRNFDLTGYGARARQEVDGTAHIADMYEEEAQMPMQARMNMPNLGPKMAHGMIQGNMAGLGPQKTAAKRLLDGLLQKELERDRKAKLQRLPPFVPEEFR